MRILLFFDLPRDTNEEKRVANKFAKDLVKDGFIMLQESVYCKLVLNSVSIDFVRKRLNQIKPKRGNIILLNVTEKQFNSMEYLLGEAPVSVESTDQRMVII